MSPPQPEPWANDYIGLPFREHGRARFRGVDCWGLVVLGLWEQAGIRVPSFDDCYCSTEDTEVIAAAIAREKARLPFRPVAVRRPGESARDYLKRLAARIRPLDVLELQQVGDLCHVGLACGGGQFLHTEAGINCVMNAFAGEGSSRWAARLAAGGAYRHARLWDDGDDPAGDV